MRNYNDWESTLLWHMEQLRASLASTNPDIEAVTLFLMDYEPDPFREQVSDKKILVKFSLGPTNPSVPHTSKDHRILQFTVEFRNLKNREHCVVVDKIFQRWGPGLNFQTWNANGSDNFADYTVGIPVFIQDLREGSGYNGNDGRYVLPFALDLKYPKL